MRGQLCPIVRTWDDLERSIWAGFTCATVDAADIPIHIPAGAEPYDFSRFTIYVKGKTDTPALLTSARQPPTGLHMYFSPQPQASGTRPGVDIASATDGTAIEFRSAQHGSALDAVQAWSRANAEIIAARFERLESDRDERGWVIRVHLAG